jgi:uncharacterized protein YbjT (DUF2867 family)
MNSKEIVLVTGATGYIGGRLVPKLLEKGYQVRVLVRDADRLQGRGWVDQVQVFEGDVLRKDTLPEAMDDVCAAYYMIHSMMVSSDFHERDLIAARNFAETAREQGVQRIIYLGGLGDPESELSEHLNSRQQTGEALRESGLPVIEFRAAVVVGSGSVSFEMIRYLTERLPVMICPLWVYTRIQPISIRDVLEYLVAGLKVDVKASQVVEIGGSDVVTYADMMLKYAKVRGLKRWLFRVPVLTPRLSSYWVHWMTPIPAEIARPLIDGLKNEVIIRDNSAESIFPNIKPMNYEEAVTLALEQLQVSHMESSWSDSLSSSLGDRQSVALKTYEGMIIERRQQFVSASPEQIFEQFSKLGGEYGWLYMNWAWRVRGVIDRLVGGVGFRRGRRHPREVRVGDALDFWRVEEVQKYHLLRLRAEMKVPGKAWLQFEVSPQEDGRCSLTQTAFFAPKGLFGILYWYLLYPFHSLIFSGLIREIAVVSK